MLILLISCLRAFDFLIPSAFDFYSTRALGACFSSLVFVLFLGPFFIRKLIAWKIGQKIRVQECPQLGLLHEKKEDTPTMGGVLIIFAVLFSSLLWMNLMHAYTWILMLSISGLGALGAYDDYLKLRRKNTKGLSGRYKLLGQCVVGILLAWFLLQAFNFVNFLELPSIKGTQVPVGDRAIFARVFFIPFEKNPYILPSFLGSGIFLAFFYTFVVTGSSNAVNLTDGLDGLASGLLILCALPLAVVGYLCNHVHLASYLNLVYLEGSGEVTIFLASLIGGALGFLWFNGYPAQVFMGDTGSLGLGGVLGVAAILLRREFLLAIAGGVFVIETLSVIIQVWSFRKRGKRVFRCAPIHHHFEYLGWHESKVVLRFWILGFLFSLISLISLKLQ